MDATSEQIDNLLHLQELDRTILLTQKALDSLPQREEIVRVRTKAQELAKKGETVTALLGEAKDAVMQIQDEREQILEKQESTQQKIEESQADFRSVESLSRDLGGMAKRLETLDFNEEKAQKKLDEVQVLSKKVAQAKATFSAQEAALIDDYRQQGTQLTTEIQEARDKRDAAAASLPADLLKAYESAAKKCGGIGVATLKGETCGACRQRFDGNKLLKIKSDAPVSICPACKRLMVV